MPSKQINKAGRYIISKGRLSGHPHGIYEQTRALKVNPRKTITIETDFGEVDTDSIVIATNSATGPVQ